MSEIDLSNQENQNSNQSANSGEKEDQKYELLPMFAEGISKIRQRCQEERNALENNQKTVEEKTAIENYINSLEEKLNSIEEVLQSLTPQGQSKMTVGWHISPHWQDILSNGLWQTKNRATIYNIASSATMDQLGFSLFLTKGTEQRPVFVMVPKDFLSESGGAIVRAPTEEEQQSEHIPDRIKGRSKEMGYIPPSYLL